MSLESKEIVADNELDDFFAKKDKKGKKKKKNQAKDTGKVVMIKIMLVHINQNWSNYFIRCKK